jgi:hypothetical protein
MQRSFTNLVHELQVWTLPPYISTKRIDQISGRVLRHDLTLELPQTQRSSIVARESPSPPSSSIVNTLADFVNLSLSPCICPVVFEEAPHEIILDHVSPLYDVDELPPVALTHALNALAVFDKLASPQLKGKVHVVGCFLDVVNTEDPQHVVYDVGGALHTLPSPLPLVMFTAQGVASPASARPSVVGFARSPTIPLGSTDSLKNPPLGFPWMLE